MSVQANFFITFLPLLLIAFLRFIPGSSGTKQGRTPANIFPPLDRYDQMTKRIARNAALFRVIVFHVCRVHRTRRRLDIAFCSMLRTRRSLQKKKEKREQSEEKKTQHKDEFTAHLAGIQPMLSRHICNCFCITRLGICGASNVSARRVISETRPALEPLIGSRRKKNQGSRPI